MSNPSYTDDDSTNDESRAICEAEEGNPMNRNELTDPERLILQGLAAIYRNHDAERIGVFGWNTIELLRSLSLRGLVEYRELPHTDGDLVVRLTDRGLRSYQKGVKLGIYTRIALEIAIGVRAG